MEVDLILIGRNEGARLERSLASVRGQARRVVYVDSGSIDGSVAMAREAGVDVVELTANAPFTAARARHEGFEHLEETGGAAEAVHFVDGDCELVEGWLPQGAAALGQDPGLGLVTGWRSEIAPDASLYNAVCQVEWRRPAGAIETCGGDMLVRSAAYRAVGGFNAQVIAAEDDEFCCRLRKAGWRLLRLPEDMTRHDAAMLRFGQWWRRAVRTGHGFEQVNDLHPEYFRRERLRMGLYGLVGPALLIGAVIFGLWTVAVMGLAVYGLSFWRTAQGLRRDAGLDASEARRHAVLLTLSKLPNAMGALQYRWRKAFARPMGLIEYK